MSLQQSLTPYLRTLSAKNVRTFAAAAAKAKESSQSDSTSNAYLKPREELRTTVLDGVTVSSVETNKPISKLAVYFKAGSRFETDSTQGTAHALRIYAGLGTNGSTAFGITRNIEFAGGNFYCTTGREHVAYTVEVTRDKLPNIEQYLQDATVNQAFKPWEVSDNVPRLRLDRATRPPEVRVLELIHKVAYRKGLGYSTYSPKWMVGNHTSEMLLNFVKTNFVEASVVGVGLPHGKVLDFASQLNIKIATRKPTPSKFNHGSELRKETSNDLAYVALAIEGASIAKPKEMIASALVHRALGSGPRTKRGLSGGKLSAATADVIDNASATAFSASYSDSGLLGVFIAATPCCIEKVTKKSAEILRGASFTDADSSRAKAMLFSDLAMVHESDDGTLEEIGLQSLHNGKVTSIGEISKLIESVSASDMNALVKAGKLSMASYGKVANVPYINELK